MNLPNKLTLSRVIMIPFFILCLELAGRVSGAWQVGCTAGALLIFIGASITDYWDGVIARRRGLTTDFGRLFDPLADKLLITSAFIIFVRFGIFPAWVVILILCREFIITGLRGLGERSGRIIAAESLGKHKTLSQMIVIVTTLLYMLSLSVFRLHPAWARWYFSESNLDWWLRCGLDLLLAVCIVFTIYSGAAYLWKNWDLIRNEE